VLDGRDIDADDRRGGPLVCVVNSAFAESLWPGERSIGKRFEFADGRKAGLLTVVGVVGDVATDGLEVREPPAVYAPYVQRTLPFLRWMTLVIRNATDAATSIAPLRARLQEVDPRQPIYAVSTMEAAIARSVAERKFAVVLVSSFATLTLILAMLGVYGMLADRVAGRSREIGVRLALGAAPARVFRLIVGEGAILTAAGVALGALVIAAALPLVRDALFGVAASDIASYGAIVTLLVIATLAASAVPALAAARIDPVRTLREDRE
jgi:putative ABC transport system permease protein